MASLNNLYISQSYQGLLHFGSNTASVAQLGVIEDGLGNSLGLFLNNNGDLRTTTSISSSRIEATNLVIKNKIEITGSVDIDGPVTASSALIEGNLNVLGSLTASAIYTLIESASIIYSSGSNILGDSTADVQTLNGTVIVSGSEQITGSLFVTNNISSSTISGIGNVTTYSQSVDARLDYLEGPFSTSVDSRLDNLENFTASTYQTFSQSVDNRLDGLEATASYLNTTFSQSVDFRLDELESWSSSLQTNFVTQAELTQTASFLQNQINQKLNTSSFNSYTSSTNVRLNNLETTSASVNVSLANLNSFTQSYSASVSTSFSQSYAYINSVSQSISASITSVSQSISSSITALSTSIQVTDNAQTQRLNLLSSFTGSYATTGSNVFIGNQTITGSLILSSSAAVELTTIGNSLFSGSVRGQVLPLTITSGTASMDLSLGNFFTLTLVSGSTTHLTATNILPGETIALRVLQPTGSYGNLSVSPSIRFPQTSPYIPTPSGSAIDVISFLVFDTSFVFGVAVNTMR